MSDDEFTAALALPDEDHRLATAIRRTLAQMCRIEPEKLYPIDDTEMLSNHMPAECFLADASFDELTFVLELEALTGLRLNLDENLPRFVPGRFFWLKYPKSQNLGAWVTDSIGVIRSADPDGATGR